MRSFFARLAVLGVFAVSTSACGGGSGTALPFAAGPNSAGGNAGTFQSSGTGTALIRFIQGSPDASAASGGSVDVCVDSTPVGSIPYGKQSGLYAVSSGIGHSIAVYQTIAAVPGSVPGAECATAPGPYFGANAIAYTTVTPGASTRLTFVLGGTNAAKDVGLYAFTEPTYANAPGGPATISHNAAAAFSAGGKNVGFGLCSTTAVPCSTPVALTGAQNVVAPKPSTPSAAVSNGAVFSSLASVPAGFYDGAGVPAGTPVPITSVAAPSPLAAAPYIVALYAIDAPAGGLNLLSFVEQTQGYGF